MLIRFSGNKATFFHTSATCNISNEQIATICCAKEKERDREREAGEERESYRVGELIAILQILESSTAHRSAAGGDATRRNVATTRHRSYRLPLQLLQLYEWPLDRHRCRCRRRCCPSSNPSSNCAPRVENCVLFAAAPRHIEASCGLMTSTHRRTTKFLTHRLQMLYEI